MLPRILRLSRQGFEHAQGLTRANSPHFSVSYGTTKERGGSGIIVPKKVVKSAAGRHLLKRRVRSILRPWSARDRIIIVVARTGAQTLPYQELEDELSSLFASIIKE